MPFDNLELTIEIDASVIDARRTNMSEEETPYLPESTSKPTTLKGIVADILERMDAANKVHVASIAEDGLIQFHSTWGRADTDREFPWLHDRLVKLHEIFKPPVLKLQKKADETEKSTRLNRQ